LKTTFKFIAIFTALFLCACYTHHPEPVSVSIPENFSVTGTASLNSRWWEEFQDPELNRLVSQVLSDNLNLKQALARLKQAGALADQTAGYWHPQANIGADAGRSRTNVSAGTETVAVYSNRYVASAAVSYEIDLWGRIAALNAAAQLDENASQNDWEAMSVTLAAETAETWFSLIEQNALLRLAQDQLEVNQKYLKLIQLRFAQGQASALDVYQQRQQAEGSQAYILPIQSTIQSLLHKLAVLSGQPPRNPVTEGHANLPELPKLPNTGLPSALLKARPDLQAALIRVIAADYRVGAAIADHFPSLSLSLSGGFRASELPELFENMVWDIVGSLSGTLWDGGRKAAEVRRVRAVLEERVAAYIQTCLEAFQEVEDALVKETHQREYLEKLKAQVGFAKKALEQSRMHYLNGQDDYLRVLTAMNSLHTLEQRLISAEKQLLSYRIQLYRALGGSVNRQVVK
jgi:NodT family efflux transporter outer membrane factor (OMF) lipoprotein